MSLEKRRHMWPATGDSKFGAGELKRMPQLRHCLYIYLHTYKHSEVTKEMILEILKNLEKILQQLSLTQLSLIWVIPSFLYSMAVFVPSRNRFLFFT